MANPKNTLTFNGKVYDVTTGNLINPQLAKAKNPAKLNYARVNSIVNSPIIDGLVKPKTVSKAKVAQPKTKVANRHRPQHAKTLMRRGLKPAAHSSKLHKQHGKKLLAKLNDSLNDDHDKARHERSGQVVKSRLVRHFSNTPQSPVVKKLVPLAVKKPKANNAKPTPNRARKSKPEAPIDSLSEMFTRALDKATSHNQPAIKQPTKFNAWYRKLAGAKRSSKIMFSLLVVVSVLAILTWIYLPMVQMRIASVHAGFNAGLPGYQPAGFSRRAIDSKQGQVTLTYASNSDNRSFNVVQSTSSWDSETLLDSFINPDASRRQTLQTYQDQGKTIYLYSGSSATWVSGGVWYKIEGNSNLSSDQLLRIADSL